MEQAKYDLVAELEKIKDDRQNSICQYIPMAQAFRTFTFPVTVRRVVYSAPFEKFLHMHDFPQVWYCRRGSYRHTVEGREYLCRAGSMLTVPTGKSHFFRAGEEETELVCLECSFYFLKQLPQDIRVTALAHLFCSGYEKQGSGLPGLYLEIGQGDRVKAETILLELSGLDYQSYPNVDRVLKGIGELYRLESLACPEAALAAAESLLHTRIKPLYDAARYCNYNYLSVFTGDDLAEISHMCHTGFYMAFKELFGITYKNYMYALRIYRVRLLMGHTHIPLTYIADLFNFTDINHMRKLFKRYYGLTLFQYRKLCEEKQLLYPDAEPPADKNTWERINIE